MVVACVLHCVGATMVRSGSNELLSLFIRGWNELGSASCTVKHAAPFPARVTDDALNPPPWNKRNNMEIGNGETPYTLPRGSPCESDSRDNKLLISYLN